MNRSYQNVWCHLLVTLPSLPLLKSYEIPKHPTCLPWLDTLPFSEKTSTETTVLIHGVECGCVNEPLHNIYLTSDLVSGPVAVSIRPSLPLKSVHLL